MFPSQGCLSPTEIGWFSWGVGQGPGGEEKCWGHLQKGSPGDSRPGKAGLEDPGAYQVLVFLQTRTGRLRCAVAVAGWPVVCRSALWMKADCGRGRPLAEVGQQDRGSTRMPGSVELAQCLSHALFIGCRHSDIGISDRKRHAIQSPLTQ